MAEEACKILGCTCHHDYQDKKYGAGRRVMSRTAKGQYRCSVCSKERSG